MSRFNLWDFLPRHTKGYLWIAFLVAVFLIMALSENSVFDATSIALFTPSVPLYSHMESKSTMKQQEYLAVPKTEIETQEIRYTASLGLDPNDVAILVKTGATAIWRRMPAHMSTTLGNTRITPNVLYYSDSPDNINGNPVVDVLANMSVKLKASSDFTLYHKSKEVEGENLYLESGSMAGDHYLPGGWRLDKYKFLPMFQHAATVMPGKKWYVYMEDDNYFFWETLYAWLGSLNQTMPLMVGSPAFKSGEDFAHGGSGFAVNGEAMRQSFGADNRLAERWESYAEQHCCGDQVLSHVFKENGVERYKSLDGSGWAALQALPHWKMGFGRWNWCSPIMNVHKVHQRDISRLHVFEKNFMAKHKGTGRVRYRDLFIGMAKPNIDSVQKTEWDNNAAAKAFSSSADRGVNGESVGETSLTPNQIARKPWYSVETCRKACEEWDQCLSWRYTDDSCFLDHTAAMGQRIDAGVKMESGWMLGRIRDLENIQCDPLTF